jgi:hypothetical protein
MKISVFTFCVSTGLILVLPLDLKYTSLLFVSVWSDDFVLPAIDFLLDFFSRWQAAAKIFVLGQLSSSRPQLSGLCSLRLLGFPLRRFLSSLKFFLFHFHPALQNPVALPCVLLAFWCSRI